MDMKQFRVCLLAIACGVVLFGCKKDPVPGGGGSDGAVQTLKVEANGVAFNVVLVKGGTFLMGAQNKDPKGDNYDTLASDSESPVHSVTLSDYYIGETEVTQELWEAVMGPNANKSEVKGSNYPVTNVTMDSIRSFMTKLHELTGKNFRLPTEAEWEYAARGGLKSRRCRYAGSNNIGEVAWYNLNSDSVLHTVKGKKGNELGLYDMSGNVFEFCSDYYGKYGTSAQVDPTGPASGSECVVRGGSYLFEKKYSMIFHRSMVGVSSPGHNTVGFRILMEVPLLSLEEDEAGMHCTFKDVSFDLKKVDSGYFYMGAQQKDSTGRNYDTMALSNESPVHKVALSGFYMGTTEVTQALWEAVMGSNPSTHKGAGLPVENVSYDDICNDFLPKLNKQLIGMQFRLPTEAEWEYAARGGQKGDSGIYAGGSEIDKVAWYKKNSSTGTNVVATKSANALGLYDMSGNVTEWCWDGKLTYKADSVTNPCGVINAAYPVIRGGNFYAEAQECRVSHRKTLERTIKYNYLGFRLVLVKVEK